MDNQHRDEIIRKLYGLHRSQVIYNIDSDCQKESLKKYYFLSF